MGISDDRPVKWTYSKTITVGASAATVIPALDSTLTVDGEGTYRRSSDRYLICPLKGQGGVFFDFDTTSTPSATAGLPLDGGVVDLGRCANAIRAERQSTDCLVKVCFEASFTPVGGG